MEDFLLTSIPVLIAILAVGFTLLVISVQFAKLRKRQHLLQHGEVAVARVVTISQTGTSVNDVPEMRLVVDVERAGEPPRRITFAQLIDLGSMPRAGERVYVLVDPKDPNRRRWLPRPVESESRSQPSPPMAVQPLKLISATTVYAMW